MSQHPAATEFVEEFYRFSATHPEFGLEEYRSILETHGVEWSFDGMRDADAAALDSRCILAMIRVDRFCEGVLVSAFEEGMIARWLERLREIDEAPAP